MKNPKIVQCVSKGVTSTIDNVVLQRIVRMTEGAKIKNEEMFTFKLNFCDLCGKLRVFLEDSKEREDITDFESCMFCEKPVDTTILVYQYVRNKDEVVQLYCLESEGEELLAKQQPTATATATEENSTEGTSEETSEVPSAESEESSSKEPEESTPESEDQDTQQ